MKKKICVLCACLGLIFGVGAASIYAVKEISVTNKFTTGVVDIKLDDYTINDGKEVKWKDDIENVLPGDNISKITRITNNGNDCYIRANVRFIDTPLNAECIYGISEKWFLASDGYYYYTEILHTGDDVNFIEGFKIPTNLSEDEAESSFEMKIDVDAIQSNHFEPDYNAENPWGDVEILKCEKEGMYDITTFKTNSNLQFQITYEGESDTLIKNESDFFANFPVLLPGDTYTDRVEIKNDSNKQVKLYFRTEALEGADLLDIITLKITKKFDKKEEVIYEGSLRAEALNKNILLATVDKGESGTFSYELYMPEEIDNKYTITEDSVIWVFSTDPIPAESVKTGDTTFLICTVLFIAGVIMLYIGCCFNKLMKRRKHESEK